MTPTTARNHCLEFDLLSEVFCDCWLDRDRILRIDSNSTLIAVQEVACEGSRFGAIQVLEARQQKVEGKRQ